MKGELLSYDVFHSLLKQSEDINKEFSSIDDTVGRSFVSFKSSLAQFLGQFDQVSGGTQDIAQAFLSLSDFLAQDFTDAFDSVQQFLDTGGDSLYRWWELATVIRDEIEKIVELSTGDDFSLGEFLGGTAENAIKGLGITATSLKLGVEEAGNALSTAIDLGDVTEEIQFYHHQIKALKKEQQPGFFSGLFGGKGDESAALQLRIEAAEQLLAESVARRDKILTQSQEKAKQLRAEYGDEVRDILYGDDARKAAREAEREEREANRARIQATLAPRVDFSRELDPKEAILAERYAKRVEKIEKSLATELETEQRAYAHQYLALVGAEELGVRTQLGYQELKERLRAQHEAKMQEIIAKGTEGRTKIEGASALLGVDLTKKAGDMTLAQQGETFRDQISAAAEHSKAFFQLNKALALATALVEAPKAILSAYKFGAEYRRTNPGCDIRWHHGGSYGCAGCRNRQHAILWQQGSRRGSHGGWSVSGQ